MALAGINPLAVLRISAIFDEIVEQFDQPGRRLLSDRTTSVPAEDGEIMARFPQGNVVVADIIELDQAAVIRADSPIRLQETKIPKIKHGKMISENMMVLLHRLQQNATLSSDKNQFDNYIVKSLSNLYQGCLDRQELLIHAMWQNYFNYSNYGIQISNVDWLTPLVRAHVLIVPAIPWNNTSSTPISDLLTIKEDMNFTYGKNMRRVTMSTECLRYVIKTQEFINLEPLFRPQGYIVQNLPTQNYDLLRPILEAMIGLSIETYDARYQIEEADASRYRERFMPLNTVYISDPADDNNTSVTDWGNGFLPETIPGAVPDMIGGGFASMSFGPIAYATGANPNGNPPGWTLWSALRGFPRKHDEAATVCMTVF